MITMVPLLLVSFGTFNIRGLGDEVKQSQLDTDCTQYKMDIICLQETKVTESYERILSNSGNKLIVCDQYTGWQRGIGFVISKRMLPFVTATHQVSSNVAYIDISLPSKNGKHTNCRIVNAYGPTNPSAEASPKLRDDFYDELTSAIDIPKNYELFICGDFNSKIGNLTNDDLDNGVNRFVGKYGIGKRNENGSSLLSFIIDNDLFLCNTAFQHKSRHLNTRIGYIRDPNNADNTIPYYRMIDYIICRCRFKKTLVNSRAYGGTSTDSDHKLVGATFRFQDRHLTFRKPATSLPVYDVSLLTSCRDVQTSFSQQVSKTISASQHLSTVPTSVTDCNTRMDNLVASVKSAADKIIGQKIRGKPRDYCNDIEIVTMSNNRHKLLQKLKQSMHLTTEKLSGLKSTN